MTTEVQWSELQRDPKSVAALADEGDVRVKRRDGAALLLTREDRVSMAAEGAVTAARALRNILVHLSPEAAADALTDEFPWIEMFSQEERIEFVTDFVRAFQASAELGQWSLVAQVVYGWRNTAAILADPVLSKALTEPIEGDFDFGPVPNPMEV